MRRIAKLLTAALVLCTGARAQRLDPADYIYPVRDVPGLCSANFGEMRPGHFHAGVDIKTDGVEGKPVVAVADGYVSRVTVSAGGYGRALYLTLRNGTTAVYGHLQRYRDDIERYVDQERTRRRANSIDLRFDPETWPVKQGDPVGRSGNSGSSMGPHLHFELRDTPTQRYRNLVHEGIIRPRDDLAPRILRIHYIEIDSVRGVCLQAPRASYGVVRGADGRYRLNRREPVETGRKGYFVAEVTDRRNGVGNTFGIWRIAMDLDGERRFEYRMDGFTPDLSRCCDAVSCYPLQLNSRNEAIRLAQLAGSPGCFYTAMEERGLVRVEAGQRRRIRIEVEDDSSNRSELTFDICGREEEFRAAADPEALALYPGRAAVIGVGHKATARIPAGALHEALFCRPERLPLRARPDSGVVALTSAFRLLDPQTPLRHAAEVSIAAEVPRRLQLRSVLAVCDSRGRLSCIGGAYANGRVTAQTRSAGPYIVAADTLPPHIAPLFADGAHLTGREASLRFRVRDNFSGIASWNLYIDGQWVPCDRFPMKGTLVHPLREAPAGRRRTVLLTATDGCGNIARWEGSFYR